MTNNTETISRAKIYFIVKSLNGKVEVASDL